MDFLFTGPRQGLSFGGGHSDIESSSSGIVRLSTAELCGQRVASAIASPLVARAFRSITFGSSCELAVVTAAAKSSNTTKAPANFDFILFMSFYPFIGLFTLSCRAATELVARDLGVAANLKY